MGERGLLVYLVCYRRGAIISISNLRRTSERINESRMKCLEGVVRGRRGSRNKKKEKNGEDDRGKGMEILETRIPVKVRPRLKNQRKASPWLVPWIARIYRTIENVWTSRYSVVRSFYRVLICLSHENRVLEKVVIVKETPPSLLYRPSISDLIDNLMLLSLKRDLRKFTSYLSTFGFKFKIISHPFGVPCSFYRYLHRSWEMHPLSFHFAAKESQSLPTYLLSTAVTVV